MRFLILLVLMLPMAVAAEVRLVDDVGREVILPEHARRIVSLAPHITEVVYAAGASLVGAVEYSDYPAAARDVPRVGSHNKVSFETLLDVEPELVLAWHSGNGEEVVQRIEALGIPVFVQDPRTLEDVARTIEQVGQLAGTEPVAQAQARRFMERHESLRSRYSDRPALSVYYQIWNEPLLTLNGEHLISDVIRLCGGRNAFAEAMPLVSRLSVESVLSVDPQVIVASGMAEERPEWLDDWLSWPSLQAVTREQLYFVPPDLLQRHTPRIMEGAALLCEQLEEAREAYGL